ncbi:MAG: acyl carrier protein [Clostridia bacterium]|nr:acyl carrier protein [Clostridia bacterium]MBR3416517.1 acyl carrier protein [Clostridia bacterium]
MFENVKRMLVDELSVNEDDVTPEAELVGDLGVNSLELADLVLLCEEKFNIEINEDDIRGFITVGDVVDYLEKEAK